jgi:hypothetical protein
MKLITVVTHSDFYFPILKESCAKNNLELIILGFGKKWEGFTWRFSLLKEYLSSLDPDEIVLVTDGFDVIVLNTNDIIKKFHSYKTDILFSAEYVHSYFYNWINQTIYPECHGSNLSVGVYMGKVNALLKFYINFCKLYDCSEFNLEDQRAVSKWCPNTIKLDTKGLIFYNHNLTTNYNIKGNKILTPDTEPCIVHGAGNANLHPIAELYGYDTSKIRQLSIVEAYAKRIPSYIKYFGYEIAIVVIIVIILIITNVCILYNH